MFDYALKKFFFTDVANLQSHTIRVVITKDMKSQRMTLVTTFSYCLQEWHEWQCPHPTSNTPIRYWSNDPIKQKMALLLPSLKALSQVNNTVRRQSLSCRHHNVWCLDTFALLSLANV